MASFRKEILGQIERIDTGRIFTFRDLSFETEKTANVAVLLSEQSRKGVLVRVEKGAYYRPKKSVLGLGKLPVYQDEQFRYLTEKLNGYITGAYVYNKMGLTEQVATTITIATPNPVRRFRFKNLDIECVKAYCMDYPDERTCSASAISSCTIRRWPKTPCRKPISRPIGPCPLFGAIAAKKRG